MSFTYHTFPDNGQTQFLPGKIVCIGRNYAEHIAELNNETPAEPVIFMKPNTALQDLREPIIIPDAFGACHHEVELAIVIGKKMSKISASQVIDGIYGYAIALDLTLREVQSKLKEKGLPWEKAKAFDGSCPLSSVIPRDRLVNPNNTELKLTINGKVRQSGNTSMMIWKVEQLIAHISEIFTLLPGDLVLTGTPSGVGPLNQGDQLLLELDNQFTFETRIN